MAQKEVDNIKVCALASGSSGNCTYVQAGEDQILIDAGISCKEIVSRLTSIGRDPHDIKAIFITHEHIDHIRGAGPFSRRFNTPIFVNQFTLNACADKIGNVSIQLLTTSRLDLNSTTIEILDKSHDAARPVSFIIHHNNKQFGVITDIGTIDPETQQSFSYLDGALLEFNHDVDMLISGPYPWHLKNRISSDHGHLSNFDACRLITGYAASHFRTLIFGHLSETNNTPDIVISCFHSLVSSQIDIIQAHLSSRHEPTPLLDI